MIKGNYRVWLRCTHQKLLQGSRAAFGKVTVGEGEGLFDLLLGLVAGDLGDFFLQGLVFQRFFVVEFFRFGIFFNGRPHFGRELLCDERKNFYLGGFDVLFLNNLCHYFVCNYVLIYDDVVYGLCLLLFFVTLKKKAALKTSSRFLKAVDFRGCSDG